MSESLPKLSYYQIDEFVGTLRGRAVRVISKPGLPNWDRITPAPHLLADAVKMSPDSQALLLGCSHGALGVILAWQIPNGNIWLMDTSYIALTMAEQTLQANKVVNAHVNFNVTVLPTHAEAFDTVVMVLPKGRRLARRWLVESYAALRAGGQLYLAGANKQGIKSVVKDIEALFGNVAVLGYKKGNRVARATKDARSSAPSWIREPGIAPGSWYEFKADVREMSFRLRSLPGIFAYDRLDDGTKLLLTKLSVPQDSQVLDVGCGYGIIGLFAARLGAAHVDMVDVNMLAVAAARENITYNDITNARAFPSDALSAVDNKRYNLIVTNPPFHTGKAVDYDVAHAFIEHARYVLEPRGQLVLVANKFIPYDQLVRALFNNVECLIETGRYHVLVAT